MTARWSANKIHWQTAPRGDVAEEENSGKQRITGQPVKILPRYNETNEGRGSREFQERYGITLDNAENYKEPVSRG